VARKAEEMANEKDIAEAKQTLVVVTQALGGRVVVLESDEDFKRFSDWAEEQFAKAREEKLKKEVSND
jgi:hypothetical protein